MRMGRPVEGRGGRIRAFLEEYPDRVWWLSHVELSGDDVDLNKGGIYYSALVSPAARAVPGVLFVGGKDLLFRTQTIVGLFSINRRAGALWALTEEPSAEHVVGRSEELATVFFDEILPLRLDGAVASPAGGGRAVPNYPTAWLPTERVVRAWRAVVTETS